MKVAVIDDEADIRDVIRDLLEKEGHVIVEADNGLAGLELIRSSRPDLIICDIRMPQMTGDELFDALRNPGSDLDVIPFIFLSGNANEQEQIKRLKRGADNCFEKPVDLALLAAHVNAHLSSVTRISDFFQRKLDTIAEKFPERIAHDFNSHESLAVNASGYVDVIVTAIHKLSCEDEPPGQDGLRGIRAESSPENMVKSRHSYIKYCLSKFEKRRALVRSANGEDLSWTLIFLIVQAEMEVQKIFVSDLYVSIPSAKSTINARISSLVDEGVITKNNDLTDGRRQFILLTDSFRPALMNHLDGSLALLRQVV